MLILAVQSIICNCESVSLDNKPQYVDLCKKYIVMNLQHYEYILVSDYQY